MINAELQISAGICLIVQSGLLKLSEENKFSVQEIHQFENFANEKHPKFGRIMCWILFSTGVEYLCKGYLISKKSLTPTKAEKIKLAKESEINKDWTEKVLARDDKVVIVNEIYDQLGGVTQRIASVLIKKSEISSDIANKTRSVLGMFTDAIRNRDAHAYMEDVRKDHFELTKPICEALNVVMGAIDAKMLNKAARVAIKP
jgi:hypothetical protein